MASGVGDMDNLFGDIGEEFEAKKSKVKDASKKSNKPKAPEIVKDGKRVQNISIMMASLTNHGKRSLGQLAECVSYQKKNKKTNKNKTKTKKTKKIFFFSSRKYFFIYIDLIFHTFFQKKTKQKKVQSLTLYNIFPKNNLYIFSLFYFF